MIRKALMVGIPIGAMFLLPRLAPLVVKVRTVGGTKVKGRDRLRAAVEVTNTGDVDLTNVRITVTGGTQPGVYEIPIISQFVDIPAGATVRIPETGLAESDVIPADAPTGTWGCFAWANWDTQQAFTKIDNAWEVREPIKKAEISIVGVG